MQREKGRAEIEIRAGNERKKQYGHNDCNKLRNPVNMPSALLNAKCFDQIPIRSLNIVIQYDRIYIPLNMTPFPLSFGSIESLSQTFLVFRTTSPQSFLKFH
jgi:hypothetical protein